MAGTKKIESDDLTLAEVFRDFYSVPDFQREYVWKEEHVEKLLQDVYDEFYDENKTLAPGGEYFIGSIVTFQDEKGVFQLIDGQQRLTTGYLVLCVIHDMLKELKTDPPATILGQISATSMDPATGDDVFRYRLVLQYEDSQDVLEKIASSACLPSTIPPNTSSVEHILNAYQVIVEFLRSNFDGDAGKVKAFAAAFTLRVKLIRIVTPDLSHALKLFETINDRGVGLNAMDLLKNLLFMRTSSEQYSKLKELWKSLIDTLDKQCREKPLRFLRYYILSHYALSPNKRELREDEIYTWFAENQATTGIDKDPIGFLNKLIRCSEAYANFAAGKNVQARDNRYLQNIARLSNQARQHFILLLAAREMPEPLFDRLCQKIENLFFCYLVTREPTKNFERSFTRWSAALRDVRDEAGLSAFVERNFVPDLAGRATAFEFALGQLSEHRIQQYRLRYILAKLSQFIDESAWATIFPLDRYYNSVQIEHILPQNPTEEARTSFDKSDEYDAFKVMLGNLTLLEKGINASVSNDVYHKKRAGYAASKILLTESLTTKPHVGKNTQLNRATQDLPQFDKWDSEAITARQAMLVRLARQVWEIPDSSSAVPA